MKLFARVWPARKLIAVAPVGPGVPLGKIARSPAVVGPVTVRFVTTARAVAGMPHAPAS